MSYLEQIDRQAEAGILWGTCTAPGSPRTAGITTAFSATAAFACLRNASGDPKNGKIIIPQYLKLRCNVVPASATSLELAISIDDIDRYSSGDASPLVGFSSRSDQLAAASFPSVADLRTGAIVLNAAGANAKIVGRQTLKSTIPAVGDVFIVCFGPVVEALAQLSTGASAQTYLVVFDPIALINATVKHSLNFHLWAPANAATAGQYEVEAGWVEKS